MNKKTLRLIFQGGMLSAAFSFSALIFPPLGFVFYFLTLAPLFYVGIRTNLKNFILAALIPCANFLLIIGLRESLFFIATNLIPAFAVLYWHHLKRDRHFIYSRIQILHNLSITVLICITALSAYAALSQKKLTVFFGLTDDVMQQFSKLPLDFSYILELWPAIICFVFMLTVWFNYQLVYAYSLKYKNIRNVDKTIQSLPAFWDIILISGLWIHALQNLWIPNFTLSIFSKTIIGIAAFPLLIEGLDIVRLIAKAYKTPPSIYLVFLALIFLLVWPISFIVLLGLIEPWYGLKKKYISNLGA